VDQYHILLQVLTLGLFRLVLQVSRFLQLVAEMVEVEDVVVELQVEEKEEV
jgi:hypothetical protein